MLRITYRQRRLLRRIDRALRQSDPELAAMLSIFSRLNAGERMPAWEQLRTPEPSASWYMMPWPMAIVLLAIWAPAAGPLRAAPRPHGRWTGGADEAVVAAQPPRPRPRA
jgi:hypothetical protein